MKLVFIMVKDLLLVMVKDLPWATATGVVVVQVSQAIHYLPPNNELVRTIVLGLVSGASIIIGKWMVLAIVRQIRKLYSNDKANHQ